VAGTCGYGEGLSGSINAGNFLTSCKVLLVGFSRRTLLHGVSKYIESQRNALFLNFILMKKSTCFGQIYSPSSGVLILYSQQQVFVTLVMLNVDLASRQST
jgi:hypothetical protein